MFEQINQIKNVVFDKTGTLFTQLNDIEHFDIPIKEYQEQ